MCCCSHGGGNPGYTFGSALITIIVGALAFITALAWNDLARALFNQYCDDPEDDITPRLSYALVGTATAIVVGFLVMQYVDGSKW